MTRHTVDSEKKKSSEIAWRAAVHVTLIALIALIYAQVARFGFVNFDDPTYVTENPWVQAGLTWANVRWAFTTDYFNNWYPLTWLSFMLGHQVFGSNAGGPHLVNVALHILNACLLFEILRRMTGNLFRSALVAALFAVHPLHVESVAWIAERKDVLSTCFAFLALLAYTGYVKRPGYLRNALVVLALALGLMAKPMLVTFPFLLLLLDYWPLGRFQGYSGGAALLRRLGVLANEKLALFLLSFASCVITLTIQSPTVKTFSLEARIFNALISYVVYGIKAVAPIRLAVFYPHPGEAFSLPWGLGAGLLLLVVSALVFLVGRRRPYLPVGWLWYLGTLVPVIGFIQVSESAMADRYTYVSLIGLFIAAVWGLADLAAAWRFPREVAAAIAGLVLCGLTALAAYQTAYWRDSVTLFEHARRVTTNNALAYNCLGLALADQGRTEAAVNAYKRALEIDPTDAKALTNLGGIRAKQGASTEAETCFRKALASDPSDATAHYCLGLLLAASNKPSEAMAEYNEAVKLNPYYTLAYNSMGNLLAASDKVDEAIGAFHKALRIDPRFIDARVNLGNALTIKGQRRKAAACYEEVLQTDPNCVSALVDLGDVLLELGRPDEARPYFERALKLDPAQPNAKKGIELAEGLKKLHVEQGKKPPAK